MSNPADTPTPVAERVCQFAEAQRARLLRTLEDIKDAPAWRAVWSQMAAPSRVIAGTFLGRRTNQ